MNFASFLGFNLFAFDAYKAGVALGHMQNSCLGLMVLDETKFDKTFIKN